MNVRELELDHPDRIDQLAEMFGSFELVAVLTAVAAPGLDVLVYRPPSRADLWKLRAFTAHTWTQVDRQLWLTHDGDNLLLSTSNHQYAPTVREREQEGA